MLTGQVHTGLVLASDTSPSPEPVAWSSAVGHASTGKSGRVIERLQGDIDRLHRDKQLLKFRYEESEKANEALAGQNQYLQDRNSNFEQSHEATQRQVARKDRLVEELREEVRREKGKTATATESAEAARASEEIWKDQANLAKTIASQKEMEYNAMVACRNRDNSRHQGGLDKMKTSFQVLLRDRQEDLDDFRKLEIVAEQQKQTISQLEEYSRKITANFKAYRGEIDTAIARMREAANSNDTAVTAKLDEMTKITGEMRWLINLERQPDHRVINGTST